MTAQVFLLALVIGLVLGPGSCILLRVLPSPMPESLRPPKRVYFVATAFVTMVVVAVIWATYVL